MKDKEAVIFLATMAGWGMPEIPRKRYYEKRERKCLLPGCGNMTSHNGGYCCADHCREHRRLRKVNATAGRTDEGGSVQ